MTQVQATVGSGRICPIFSISGVTGEGVELLRKFLSMLPMSIVREQTGIEQAEIARLQKEAKLAGTCKDEKENPEVSQLGGATPAGKSANTSMPEVHTKFIVDSRYFCKGVGLILGGTVLKGTVRIDQQMMFGPDRNGNFKPVVVKGIHENRVEQTEAGEMASVCVHIKTLGKSTEPIKNN